MTLASHSFSKFNSKVKKRIFFAICILEPEEKARRRRETSLPGSVHRALVRSGRAGRRPLSVGTLVRAPKQVDLHDDAARERMARGAHEPSWPSASSSYLFSATRCLDPG